MILYLIASHRDPMSLQPFLSSTQATFLWCCCFAVVQTEIDLENRVTAHTVLHDLHLLGIRKRFSRNGEHWRKNTKTETSLFGGNFSFLYGYFWNWCIERYNEAFRSLYGLMVCGSWVRPITAEERRKLLVLLFIFINQSVVAEQVSLSCNVDVTLLVNRIFYIFLVTLCYSFNGGFVK